MKTKTTQKKVWTKPVIIDLDLKKTKSGNNGYTSEWTTGTPTWTPTSSFGINAPSS